MLCRSLPCFDIGTLSRKYHIWFELCLPKHIADFGDILAESNYFISTTIQILKQHQNQTNMKKITNQNHHTPPRSHKQPQNCSSGVWCHTPFRVIDRIVSLCVLMYILLVQSINYEFFIPFCISLLSMQGHSDSSRYPERIPAISLSHTGA